MQKTGENNIKQRPLAPININNTFMIKLVKKFFKNLVELNFMYKTFLRRYTLLRLTQIPQEKIKYSILHV